MWVCYENLCVSTKEQHQWFSMCMCVCVRVCMCMCAGKKENWAQGSRDFGVTARKCLGRWGGGQAPMTRQVMWPLVLTEALGSQKQEGSVLSLQGCSLFVQGASLLNADKSVLKYQHQSTSANWPERGRTEAAHLSVCMSPLSGSVFCCLSWWQGEEGNTSLPLFFLTQVRLQIL